MAGLSPTFVRRAMSLFGRRVDGDVPRGYNMSTETTQREQPRRRGQDRRRGSGRRIIRDRRREMVEVPFEHRSGTDRRSSDQRRTSADRRTPPQGLKLL
jgi:hypothetical protein